MTVLSLAVQSRQKFLKNFCLDYLFWISLMAKNILLIIPGKKINIRKNYFLFYKLLSIKAVNCDLESAPILVFKTSPSLNNIKVGIPLIPYLGGVLGFSSIFNLAIFNRPT
ncbi:membrane protein [Beggiatoa sp. PS]|nr:membrane protein [Beggiatoa sp. PS]